MKTTNTNATKTTTGKGGVTMTTTKTNAIPMIDTKAGKALFENLATLYNPAYTYHTQRGNVRKYILNEKYLKENSAVPFLKAFYDDCLSLYKRLDANTRHHSDKSLRRVDSKIQEIATRFNIGDVSAVKTLVYNAYGNRVLSDKQRTESAGKEIMATTGFATFLKGIVVSFVALHKNTLIYRESKTLIATLAKADKQEALQDDVKKARAMSEAKKTKAAKTAEAKRAENAKKEEAVA